MPKILVTGGNGQLGQSIQSIEKKYKELDFIYTDVNDLDICNLDELRDFLANNKVQYLINCAAYTAVDKAEQEQTLAKKINSEALENIGIATAEKNIKVLHVSTDYVFDGKSFKPYTEDELAVPESFYGQTKLLGEKLLLQNQPDSVILRTSWLYSEFGNNFVKTMIKLGNDRDELNVVADQIGTPTYAVDLADALLTIIKKVENKESKFHTGVYHFSNEGVCSWYDFTKNIHQIMEIDCNVMPIESKDYPTAAPRPFYSVLNKSKIKTTFKINIPYWKTSLERCLSILAASN